MYDAVRPLTRGTFDRTDWFYLEQEALCYLAITEKCQARNRLMLLRPCAKGYKTDGDDRFGGGSATIEHLLPRSIRRLGQNHLILLACRDCNARKGAALPELEHVERALDLCIAWNRSPYCWAMAKPGRVNRARRQLTIASAVEQLQEEAALARAMIAAQVIPSPLAR